MGFGISCPFPFPCCDLGQIDLSGLGLQTLSRIVLSLGREFSPCRAVIEQKEIREKKKCLAQACHQGGCEKYGVSFLLSSALGMCGSALSHRATPVWSGEGVSSVVRTRVLLPTPSKGCPSCIHCANISRDFRIWVS